MTEELQESKPEPFFTDYLKVADERVCNAPWLCGKNGRYFRCALCGYKFKVGDLYRAVFTNDTPGASGNPVVCEKCNGTNEEVKARWGERVAQWRSDLFWWFRRSEE